MFDYNNSTTIFIWILSIYFITLVVGLYLGKKKFVSASNVSDIGKYLADPITKKIHNLSRKYKMSFIKKQKIVFVVSFNILNNLLLAAFIIKIVYVVIFIIPLLLTVWEGFGHRMVLEFLSFGITSSHRFLKIINSLVLHGCEDCKF